MDLIDLKYIAKAKLPTGGAKLDQLYYFAHIPKTGGTTLRYVFYDYFDNSQIYPNAYEYYVEQKGNFMRWPEFQKIQEELLKTKKLIIGHYNVGPLHTLPLRPKIFSMFREPSARIISSIRYHREKGRHYAGMTVEEILDQHLSREGWTQAVHVGYHPKKDNLQEALDNISAMECIGISEQFERSLQLLNMTFGWKLKNIRKRNVAKKNNLLSTNHKKQISQASHTDQIIYDHALKIFEERCAQHRI